MREKTCKFVDVKIRPDKNVSVAEFVKLSKYKDLEIEAEKLWHLKTVTFPVVIEALSMIKKSTEKTSRTNTRKSKPCWNAKISTYGHCSFPIKKPYSCKKSNNEQLKQCWMYIYWTKIDSLHTIFLFTLSILFIFHYVYIYLWFVLFIFFTLFTNFYFLFCVYLIYLLFVAPFFSPSVLVYLLINM